MKKCECNMCDCPNQIKEYGHRFEEANAIAEANAQRDPDKVYSIIDNICESCEKGQHTGQPS